MISALLDDMTLAGRAGGVAQAIELQMPLYQS
jgi:hypothetical protein